ncbi:MAG: alpha/beta hydrolase [Chloroflexi bacterium]|nr:alpha/beta hydrolase [Chloroflexota bacterium]
MADQTRVVLRRHGNPDGPRLVLSHGNGLAIDLYYPFWSLLTGDFDVVVYDLRNHGWNAITDLKEHTIPTLIDDHDLVIDAIDRHLGEKPKIGVFHSLSSLAPLLSPTEGSSFEALILFDPPLCKPGKSYEEFDSAAIKTAAAARRRSYRFRSRGDFVELLQISPNFRLTVPGTRYLMAETTLREETDGEGYELRCPPEYEAQIIDYARVFAVSVDLTALQCPTKVIGADPTLPYSYLPTMDLSDMLSVDYDFLPDATHLLQLEQPEECVAKMRQFIESVSG